MSNESLDEPAGEVPPNDPPEPLQQGLTEAEQLEYDQLDRLLEKTPEQNERWLSLLSKSKSLWG